MSTWLGNIIKTRLGTGQATSHFLNQWWLVYWRIYASLKLNGLSKKEDIVGVAPTGDAPTTSEKSMILFPTKVHFISEVWGYKIHVAAQTSIQGGSILW